MCALSCLTNDCQADPFIAVELCSTDIRVCSSMSFFSRLVEYLQAMRNFFLMEGGDTMYDFYTSIFDKIREKETWQNVSLLNVQLQEAVGQRYPEDSLR